MEEYFSSIPGIGDLYLDQVLYKFEAEPILFPCLDSNKRLYLCLCSEIRYNQKWIIVEYSPETLEALTDRRIDIASAFLKVVEVIAVGGEFDNLDLPERGVFLQI